jgi:TonB family protein
MFKAITVTALLTFVVTFTFAQRQNVYYLKNSGKYVDNRDSADYIRVISEPDSGTTNYNIKEFYKSGKPKLIGKSSRIDPPLLEEQCITYFPSGKKKELASYKEGRLSGDVYDYYPNGTLYSAKHYVSSKGNPGSQIGVDYTILLCNDSTGKALLTDSNGYYLGYDNDFKRVEEEGAVKSGLKDGEWKGSEETKAGIFSFTEKYQDGKLLAGHAVTGNGEAYDYTVREKEPQFKGGLDALYRYLGNHIIYPEEARKRGIQGRVILKFVVEKDGSITDITVLKSPANDLAEEAVNVLKRSPKWMPGMQRGRAVRVQYTLPVNFSL